MNASSGGEPLGGIGGEPEPPPPAVRVLMVVDDLPISTDDAIEMRLTGLQLEGAVEIERLAEAMTTPADTEGFDLVIVSSSADSGGIGGSLKDVPVPMLVLEPNIFNLMGLGPQRSSAMDAEMTIVEEMHPIAHGRTGTIKICGGQPTLLGQELQPGGVKVAEASLNANASVIVAYDRGVDVGGALPERRVSFGALKLAGCQTETSWEFFDAAVRWLIRQSA